jgi:hypothetical protein
MSLRACPGAVIYILSEFCHFSHGITKEKRVISITAFNCGYEIFIKIIGLYILS